MSKKKKRKEINWKLLRASIKAQNGYLPKKLPRKRF